MQARDRVSLVLNNGNAEKTSGNFLILSQKDIEAASEHFATLKFRQMFILSKSVLPIFVVIWYVHTVCMCIHYFIYVHYMHIQPYVH